jgi:hypothetical protein
MIWLISSALTPSIIALVQPKDAFNISTTNQMLTCAADTVRLVLYFQLLNVSAEPDLRKNLSYVLE